MDKFNEILRSLRSREHMSQAELSERLGISKSAVGMYELGKREPDFKTLKAIAALFHVDANYLLGFHDAGERSSDAIRPGSARRLEEFLCDNPEYTALFDACTRTKKEDLEFILQILNRIRCSG